jgi:hypothetical protein
MKNGNLKNQSNAKTWLKRIGLAGFLFFLLKGIGWLIFIYFGSAIFKGCGV